MPGNSPVGEEVIAWLKANVLPLVTAEPGSGFHDLEPLHAILGNARIVSLGEATHGTREFFQLKHRLIEFCVAELGFTIIAFEAPYGEALAVNDYVLHGEGFAIDAVAGMGYWCWNTEEVVALVEWVRAWNFTHDRKVKFYGLDVQSTPAAALHLLDYLGRVAPDVAAASEAGLAPLASYFTATELSNLSSSRQENIRARIKSVLDAFDVERARWIARSSECELLLARQSAVVLEQYAGLRSIDDEVEGFTIRDRAMADNVRALLDAEGPDAKAILWAHNGHVQRTPFQVAHMGHVIEMPNMGGFLHAAFGAEQVVVGFSFNQGFFGTQELRDYVVGPTPDGFLDAALAATGIPLFALDLTRVPPEEPVSTWMTSKPVQRNIAGNFAAESEYKFATAADPRDNYDVLVFIESTTAARRNPDVRSTLQTDTGAGSNDTPKNLALASTGGIPDGWRMTDAYEGGRSPQMLTHIVTGSDSRSPAGGATVRIARVGAPLWWGDGALIQEFPAEQWRDQRLVFSAAMCAEALHIGTGAQVLIKVSPKTTDGPEAARPLVALQVGGPVRASRWTRRSVAIDIPTGAERVQISLIVTGNSAGWFGDLNLEATGSAHRV